MIADSVPLVRLAARAALLEAGLVVAAEVGTAPEALRAVLAGADVLLLDEELDPEMEMVAAISAAAPETAIVVLSTTDADFAARAAVRAGACGFVSKSTPPDRLPAIVTGVVAGEAAISRRLVRSLLGDLGPAARGRGGLAGLSVRERQVLHLLSQGLADSHVGVRLGVTEVTVRRHAAAATHKLGAVGRRQAIELFEAAVPSAGAQYVRAR